MRRAALLTLLVGGAAHAEPWAANAELGAEMDSNVQRVEVGPGLMTTPIASGVLRFGARVDKQGKVGASSLAFNLTNLTRIVSNPDVTIENTATFAGNARWLRRLGDRPVLAGVSFGGIDAIPISHSRGSRTFRTLGADAVLAMRHPDEHELLLAFGARHFTYKPELDRLTGERSREFDWVGPAANARLELMLWQPAAKTKSLELVTTLGFENRTYKAAALANACPLDPVIGVMCENPEDRTGPTHIDRRDRYQRLGVELTWVGRQVAALGYHITIIDSNSYGQSLARHRISASATAQLPGEVFGSLIAILQIDQYLDGLLVRRDLQGQEYANIEDENRSSLQLRVARKVLGEWALEGRAAIWRNLIGGSEVIDFRRELVYVGIVYGK